jgi:hypothetical protein
VAQPTDKGHVQDKRKRLRLEAFRRTELVGKGGLLVPFHNIGQEDGGELQKKRRSAG